MLITILLLTYTLNTPQNIRSIVVADGTQRNDDSKVPKLGLMLLNSLTRQYTRRQRANTHV